MSVKALKQFIKKIKASLFEQASESIRSEQVPILLAELVNHQQLSSLEKIQALNFSDNNGNCLHHYFNDIEDKQSYPLYSAPITVYLNLLTYFIDIKISVNEILSLLQRQNKEGESLGHKIVQSAHPAFLNHYFYFLLSVYKKSSSTAGLWQLCTLTDKQHRTMGYVLKKSIHSECYPLYERFLYVLAKDEQDMNVFLAVKYLDKIGIGLESWLENPVPKNLEFFLLLLQRNYLTPQIVQALKIHQQALSDYIGTLPEHSEEALYEKATVLQACTDENQPLGKFFTNTTGALFCACSNASLRALWQYKIDFSKRYPLLMTCVNFLPEAINLAGPPVASIDKKASLTALPVRCALARSIQAKPSVDPKHLKLD